MKFPEYEPKYHRFTARNYPIIVNQWKDDFQKFLNSIDEYTEDYSAYDLAKEILKNWLEEE